MSGRFASDAVYYVGPYEKSLALDLHSDATIGDPDDPDESRGKVRFLHFEGVAPRQYQNLFLPPYDRKDKSGVARKIVPRETNKSLRQYLDDYKDLESKVVQNLKEIGLIEP